MRSINRREFLHQAVGAVAGGAEMGSTALGYSRIIGANDRISLGHVGIGNRGQGLEYILSLLKDKMNVEVTAVCDIWKLNRERAASTGKKTYGRAPRAFMDLEDMLKLKDVDAVIISTPEHQHSPMLKMVAEADKHAYVEKPMGNVLEEARAARDAVLARNLNNGPLTWTISKNFLRVVACEPEEEGGPWPPDLANQAAADKPARKFRLEEYP